MKQLIDKVDDCYLKIEKKLQRPERDDLGEALQLVREFRTDIEYGTLSFPPLSENLMKLIYSEDKHK